MPTPSAKVSKESLGKVAAVTVRGSRVFEDGRRVAATFHSKKASDVARAVGAPEWAAVRVLARSGFRAIPAAIVAHPVMSSLLTIGVAPETVSKLAGAPLAIPSPRTAPRSTPTRMTPDAAFDPISPAEAAPMFTGATERALIALRLYREHGEVFSADVARSLAGARGVPHLRHLRIALNGPPAMYRWLFGSKLARQLEVLIVDLNDMSGDTHAWFGEWYAELAQSKKAPRTVRFAQWGLELALSRDAAGRYRTLDVAKDDDSTFTSSLDVLDQLTEQLPKGAVKELRVHETLRAKGPARG